MIQINKPPTTPILPSVILMISKSGNDFGFVVVSRLLSQLTHNTGLDIQFQFSFLPTFNTVFERLPA